MTPSELRELLLGLDERRAEWETLRRDREPLPSLSGIDLSGADLTGVDLADLDLSGAMLRGARLRRARLRNTDLRHANLAGADLVDADFDLARLADADLSHARMASQNLSGMDLRRADLSHADLRFAYLGYAKLDDAKLEEADLSGADLSGATLTRAQLLAARTDDNTRTPSRYNQSAGDDSTTSSSSTSSGSRPVTLSYEEGKASATATVSASSSGAHVRPAAVGDTVVRAAVNVDAVDIPAPVAGASARVGSKKAAAEPATEPSVAAAAAATRPDTTSFRSFLSDNTSGLCPEALAALAAANDGHHFTAYGDDEYTDQAALAFRSMFGPHTAVFFVPTGTAANTLAIAALTDRWQILASHPRSHLQEHESTGPELFSGCRSVAVGSLPDKIVPADLDRFIGVAGDVHQPQPGVLSISNPTEHGTLYRPEELRALCRRAHELGFRVHVDGARFANAVAALDVDPRELCSDAGVDALSFGGTKNGLACGEAVLLFRQGDGFAFERARRRLPFLRKQAGHLLSKHRFVTAPFEAVLRDGAWLRHAVHANAMAQRLADGLRRLGHPPAFPCETNSVFVRLPEAIDRKLVAAGHRYYKVGDRNLCRLVCSFDTRPEEVDAALTVVAREST